MKLLILLVATVVAVSADPRIRRQTEPSQTGPVNNQGDALQNLINLFFLPFNTFANLGQQSGQSSGGASNANPLASLTQIPNQFMNSLTTMAAGLPIIGGFLQTPTANGGTATYRCNPIEQSRIADATKEAGIVVTYPATTQKHTVEGENVTQVTYGYTMDDNTFIHSVLVGNSTTMKDFVEKGKINQRKLNNSKISGRHEVNDQELLDEAMAEYGLRSVSALTKSMLRSATKNEDVGKAFDCQMESYECMLSGRESSDIVKACAKSLCSCLAELFDQ